MGEWEDGARCGISHTAHASSLRGFNVREDPSNLAVYRLSALLLPSRAGWVMAPRDEAWSLKRGCAGMHAILHSEGRLARRYDMYLGSGEFNGREG